MMAIGCWSSLINPEGVEYLGLILTIDWTIMR